VKIPHTYDRRRDGDSTMTPMIDVVFLLLIFFVCTASFQIAEEILPGSLLAAGSSTAEIELPDPESFSERVIVKVQSAGGAIRWVVNDQPYDQLVEVHQVLRSVAQIDPGVPVILDVEGEVSLGDVIDIYDLCRLAGFDRIQFAASVKV
jgi:biopolymer transport protein ExbD